MIQLKTVGFTVSILLLVSAQQEWKPRGADIHDVIRASTKVLKDNPSTVNGVNNGNKNDEGQVSGNRNGNDNKGDGNGNNNGNRNKGKGGKNGNDNGNGNNQKDSDFRSDYPKAVAPAPPKAPQPSAPESRTHQTVFSGYRPADNNNFRSTSVGARNENSYINYRNQEDSKVSVPTPNTVIAKQQHVSAVQQGPITNVHQPINYVSRQQSSIKDWDGANINTEKRIRNEYYYNDRNHGIPDLSGLEERLNRLGENLDDSMNHLNDHLDKSLGNSYYAPSHRKYGNPWLGRY